MEKITLDEVKELMENRGLTIDLVVNAIVELNNNYYNQLFSSLLTSTMQVLNHIPNTRVLDLPYDNTYGLASTITKALIQYREGR